MRYDVAVTLGPTIQEQRLSMARGDVFDLYLTVNIPASGHLWNSGDYDDDAIPTHKVAMQVRKTMTDPTAYVNLDSQTLGGITVSGTAAQVLIHARVNSNITRSLIVEEQNVIGGNLLRNGPRVNLLTTYGYDIKVALGGSQANAIIVLWGSMSFHGDWTSGSIAG